MPEPRAMTGAMVSAEAIAQRALSSPEGITITFRVETHGSFASCKHAALSLVQSFSSLRARARRMGMRVRQEVRARDVETIGPYDRLIVQRGELANEAGCWVRFTHQTQWLSELDITDNATGKPLSEIGLGQDEIMRLSEKLSLAVVGLGEFTRKDAEKFESLRPGQLATMRVENGLILEKLKGYEPEDKDDLANMDLTLDDFG